MARCHCKNINWGKAALSLGTKFADAFRSRFEPDARLSEAPLTYDGRTDEFQEIGKQQEDQQTLRRQSAFLVHLCSANRPALVWRVITCTGNVVHVYVQLNVCRLGRCSFVSKYVAQHIVWYDNVASDLDGMSVQVGVGATLLSLGIAPLKRLLTRVPLARVGLQYTSVRHGMFKRHAVVEHTAAQLFKIEMFTRRMPLVVSKTQPCSLL